MLLINIVTYSRLQTKQLSSKRILIAFIAIIYSFSLTAQERTFEEDLNYVLNKKFTSADSLAKYVMKYRRDTLKMQTLLKESNQKKYFEGASFANNVLGIYFRDKSKYEKAIDYHKTSLNIAKNIGNDELTTSALNMLGVVYRRMDQVRMALDRHQMALSIAENSDVKSEHITKSITISYNSIGNIYLTLKQYESAEEYFRKALSLEEFIHSKLGLAINYHNIGYTYEAREVFDQALTYYKKSLAYNNEIDSDLGRVICNNSIAQVYLKQGSFQKALELIRTTLTTSVEIGDPYYIAMANISTGWANQELGYYSRALHHLNKGLKIAKENKLQSFEAEAYKHLSNLYASRNNYKEALGYNRLYQEKEEQFLNESNQRYMFDLLTKYDVEKKKAQIELLEKENEIVNIQLEQRNKIFMFIFMFSLLTIAFLVILFRQKKLAGEKRFLSLEQKLLRLQMNPHFIFNSLLSIKLYMLNNDKKSAVAYLDQFSKLIRTILSTSMEKEISLADELKTMQLYVNIENIRLCNEIDYKVSIDESLDLDSIKIPSLTLQPFIENALWHGLSAKDGYKSLNLTVRKDSNDYVEISILDNGIGRERTMKIETEKKKNNTKSIGIALTRERLANFSKNFANMHSLNIIDLYNNNNPSGTQVILKIPVR
ncbi:Tetratricopeptide repeat-containing protein [Zhouia amylolytica]|uniref:Tetratricopeptide repeat-containing protein n=1 Tax=Zhouia amylolytica TaxID=376730 RepID=A0A1I6TF12_9FLAO|nr:tetratricopeptide repeat protein [Zhouia amylolytica]SFS87812.1 Tetratricopeptide repeat-containing protein [Zhouia amylolytica]